MEIDKELLLQDLCARLPYDPIVYVDENLLRLKLGAATRVSTLATIKPKELNLWELSNVIKEYANSAASFSKEVKIVLVNKEGTIVDKRGLYTGSLENPENIATIINGKESVNIYVTI